MSTSGGSHRCPPVVNGLPIDGVPGGGRGQAAMRPAEAGRCSRMPPTTGRLLLACSVSVAGTGVLPRQGSLWPSVVHKGGSVGLWTARAVER